MQGITKWASKCKPLSQEPTHEEFAAWLFQVQAVYTGANLTSAFILHTKQDPDDSDEEAEEHEVLNSAASCKHVAECDPAQYAASLPSWFEPAHQTRARASARTARAPRGPICGPAAIRCFSG